MFVQKIKELDPLIKKNGTGPWENLTNSNSFIFNNMKPRIWVQDGGVFGNGGYEALVTDTAFWASFTFSILLIVATYMSVGLWQMKSRSTKFDYFTRFSVGCFLSSCNWIIGSQWAISVSTLVK
jgi:hypothetical protein